VRNLLRDRAPDLLDALLAAGAEEMPLASLFTPEIDDASPQPGDDDLVSLLCRRITFEWVLHRAALDAPDVSLRDGCDVTGLVSKEHPTEGLPVVTGVRLRTSAGGEVLPADWVIDASGRRSKLGSWIQEIGGEAPEEESEPCGIFYCSRFYRLVPESPTPARQAVIGADLGYLKYGIFQGDSGIFSLTFAAPPDDDPLRALLRVGPFEVAAEILPATRAWVAPEVSQPISDVHGMGNLNNTRRRFIRNGRPLALGVLPIGDAVMHTNPLYGRGCTFALVHAWLAADAVADHPHDPHAAALALEQATEREILPWYELTLSQDRDATEVARELRDPAAETRVEPEAGAPVDPKSFLRDLMRRGLIPALRSDATVLRASLRSFNLLDPPGDLMRNPELLQRVLASYQRRNEREEPELGPDRATMLEALCSAA